MQQQIQAYIDHICKDYADWKCQDTDDAGRATAASMKIKAEMIEDFWKNIGVEEGRTYIKVLARTSVHSFIVKENTGKFKKGDILKAATWKAPAKNFSRGNILEGKWSDITWTGA